MTQIATESGEMVPVTVILAGPCEVTALRTADQHQYGAVQMKFGKKLKEFRVEKTDDFKVGQEIKVDMFKVGDKVKVAGISIGKGFAGTVKRHHFSRGPMSHGSKSHRLPGSSGAGTSPGRVLPGTRRAGRMGNCRVSVRGLTVVLVNPEKNLLGLKGAIPGAGNNLVEVVKL